MIRRAGLLFPDSCAGCGFPLKVGAKAWESDGRVYCSRGCAGRDSKARTVRGGEFGPGLFGGGKAVRA